MFDMGIHSIKSAEVAESLDTRRLWYSLRHELEHQDFGDVEVHGSEFIYSRPWSLVMALGTIATWREL
jgi:hypothetical protein